LLIGTLKLPRTAALRNSEIVAGVRY